MGNGRSGKVTCLGEKRATHVARAVCLQIGMFESRQDKLHERPRYSRRETERDRERERERERGRKRGREIEREKQRERGREKEGEIERMTKREDGRERGRDRRQGTRRITNLYTLQIKEAEPRTILVDRFSDLFVPYYGMQ